MCDREIFDKRGNRHYYITSFNGDWQVCQSLSTRKTNGRQNPHGFWYILNVKTHDTKYIGPVQLKGANYFDRACSECETRNNRQVSNGDRVP